MHGGILRRTVPEKDLQCRGPYGLVDVIDASPRPATLRARHFVLSYEMMDDMMWVLAGGAVENRAAADAPGGPSLVCANADGLPCLGADRHYLLKVSPERGRPDTRTWLLRRLWPLIFRVQ